MTIGILIIALSFTWLLYETRCLTIRLPRWELCPVGACCEWRLTDSAVTDDMKIELRKQWFGHSNTKADKILRSHLWQGQPLFGWGYAYQYQNFRPPYEVQLITGTSKFTAHSTNMRDLRDAFRVWRNPYLKIKLA